MPLNYIIIDDDEFALIAVETEAARFPFLHKTAACSNSLDALEIIGRFHPEIIFADIEMPGFSGIQLAKQLQNNNQVCVFITSHPEYAVESYDINVFDYLLKPLDSERFAKCAMRIKDFFELKEKAFLFENERQADSIIIKQGYEKYKISGNDILYLEAMKNYTRIVTNQCKYLVLESISNLHAKPEFQKFIRVHRSYAVNPEKVNAYKDNKLFVSGFEIPAGKIFKKNIKQFI